jgi:hypothetical protein
MLAVVALGKTLISKREWLASKGSWLPGPSQEHAEAIKLQKVSFHLVPEFVSKHAAMAKFIKMLCAGSGSRWGLTDTSKGSSFIVRTCADVSQLANRLRRLKRKGGVICKALANTAVASK